MPFLMPVENTDLRRSLEHWFVQEHFGSFEVWSVILSNNPIFPPRGTRPSRTKDRGWKINSALSGTMKLRSKGGREYDRD